MRERIISSAIYQESTIFSHGVREKYQPVKPGTRLYDLASADIQSRPKQSTVRKHKTRTLPKKALGPNLRHYDKFRQVIKTTGISYSQDHQQESSYDNLLLLNRIKLKRNWHISKETGHKMLKLSNGLNLTSYIV